jgi:hypothetical protein
VKPSLDQLGAEGVAALFDRAAHTLRTDPARRGCVVHLPDRGRLLATGDLHDHPIHFAKVVAFAQLERPDHHLILHELIHGDRLVHGADLSWRMLAKVATLLEAHPGRVHPILANHEIAQAFDQPVSKGAGENTALFRDGLDWSFGEEADLVDAAIRRFIKAMPLAVRTEGGIFCSHSLPSPLALPGFPASVFDRDLQDADFQPRHGAAWQLTWGRGISAAQAEALAQAWGVRLFVAGHKHVPEGAEAVGERLLLLNSDHERGVVVPFHLDQPVPSALDAAMSAVHIQMIEGDPE